MKKRDVVLGVYLNTKPDSQRQEAIEPDCFEYFADWYQSINKLGLDAVVLHDCLSPQFTRQFNAGLTFVSVTIEKLSLSVYDCRYFILDEFLAKNKFDRVVITDISDVVFLKNPFDLLESNLLFVGSEPCTAWGNQWSRKHFRRVYPNYLHKDKTLLNCGIIGGHYPVIMRLLHDMKEEFDALPEFPFLLDMFVFNQILYSRYQGKFITGNPIHTEFKKWDTQNSDAYIAHK